MTLLSNRTKWMLLTAITCLFAAGTASAQSNPATCVNDIDCIATPQCGGDICDWSNIAAGMHCKPAGSQPKGQDGWCTTDADCKCKDMGATCVAAFCTFTRAPMRTPLPTNTFWPRLVPAPMRACEDTCTKCQTLTPSPNSTSASTIADG